ncbi:hypothetical protein ACFSC4_31585 [Deinococcus malanensis]|uniref:hypothetical protein n=1 Tax=Deinococcus malanensis TaxID=1706855 RepID=UPI0036268523
MTFDELETAGLGVNAILGSSNCLECRVSDQPTLEESIGEELKAERQLQEDHAQLMTELGADPLTGQAHEGSGAEEPVVEEAGELTATMALDPKEPGEDLPFPIDDEGAAD